MTSAPKLCRDDAFSNVVTVVELGYRTIEGFGESDDITKGFKFEFPDKYSIDPVNMDGGRVDGHPGFVKDVGVQVS